MLLVKDDIRTVKKQRRFHLPLSCTFCSCSLCNSFFNCRLLTLELDFDWLRATLLHFCAQKHLISEMWKCLEKPFQPVHKSTPTVHLCPKCGCTSLQGSNWVICHGIRAPTSHGICGMQMKFRVVDSRQGRSGFLMHSQEYKGIFRKCEKLRNTL